MVTCPCKGASRVDTLFYFKDLMYLLEGGCRERGRESQADSSLIAEPDAGLELTTRAKVKSQSLD